MAGIPDRVGCVSQEHDKSLLQVFSQACFCFPGRTGAPEKYFNKSTFSELHMQEEPVLQFQKRFYFNQFSLESKEYHGHSVSKISFLLFVVTVYY